MHPRALRPWHPRPRPRPPRRRQAQARARRRACRMRRAPRPRRAGAPGVRPRGPGRRAGAAAGAAGAHTAARPPRPRRRRCPRAAPCTPVREHNTLNPISSRTQNHARRTASSRWMKLAVACHTKSLGRLVTSTALQKPDTASRRQGGRCADARRAADLPQALQARHRAEVVRVGVGPEVGAVAQRERGDPARRRGAPGRALLQQAPHALVGRRLRHAGARFRGILPEYCGSSTLSSENGKRNGSSNKVD